MEDSMNVTRHEAPAWRPTKVRAAGAALGTAAALLLAGAAQAQEFNFTMAVIPAPGDAYSIITSTVPERISKATDGKVKITISDSLVPGPQIAAAVREGRVDMSVALHSYLAAEEPRLGIFNLPGLIEGMDAYKKVGESFWFEDTHKIWKERYKAVVLTEGAWCAQRLFSKTPIRTIEDFKNKRLRVHNPQTAELMNALGAKPVPLALPEVMPSLERGVIDGLFTSACYGDGQEYWRVAKHVQDWGLGPITGWAVIINADTWSKIPADLQNKMKTAMLALQQEALGNYDSYVNASVNKMKSQPGVDHYTVPAAERQRMFDPKYVQPSYDAWLARAKQVGFDGKAYLDRVRAVTGAR
jgi:TRAP-type C4-dicarboxylate transport system substrate-binding protein